MNTLDFLKRARDRISDPRNHCVGESAVDANGACVSASNPRAVQWCAGGSLYAQPVDSIEWENAVIALTRASQDLYGLIISAANDTHGHPAAMAMYDHAIAKLEAPIPRDHALVVIVRKEIRNG